MKAHILAAGLLILVFVVSGCVAPSEQNISVQAPNLTKQEIAPSDENISELPSEVSEEPEERCATLKDGYNLITKSTKLCPAKYTNSNIKLAGNHLTLDCQGAQIYSTLKSGCGIEIIGPYNTVRNCNMTNFYYSMCGEKVTGATIENNHMNYAGRYGIILSGNENSIIGNVLLETPYGIFVNGTSTIAHDNLISSNNITLRKKEHSRGISAIGHEFIIEKNIIKNAYDGIVLSAYELDELDTYPHIATSDDADGTIVSENEVEAEHVGVVAGNGCSIISNIVKNSELGIMIASTNTNVTKNNVGGCEYGIYDRSEDEHNIISYNVACGNKYDVVCWGSTGINNTATSVRGVCNVNYTACASEPNN